MKKIVIFASGQGTNAENIILHFKKNSLANVVAVFSNKPDAKVLEKAKIHNISTVVFSKEELNSGEVLLKINKYEPDLIVLAGFLLHFPANIVTAYPGKIINIHPALLPKYGGKGMFGKNVHKAILENNEIETGISIHFVNEKYDEGEMIFQKTISIEDCKTVDEIAFKIHKLEQKYFPETIEKILQFKI